MSYPVCIAKIEEPTGWNTNVAKERDALKLQQLLVQPVIPSKCNRKQ